MSSKSPKRPREVLTYISARRKCPTCIREWCAGIRDVQEKERGCTLWLRKVAEDGS